MAKPKRKVIALVNRKGGVAKTTSSGYIAAVLHAAGHKVTGIDTDPEKGWMKWAATDSLDYPVVEANQETLLKIVREIDGYIVIDTPPNDGEIITKACLVADEVIVPVAGTGHDMSRLQSTLAAVGDMEAHRGEALASVLLTRWKPNLIISREVLREMERNKIPVAQVKIHERTAYEGLERPEYQQEYRAFLEELKVL